MIGAGEPLWTVVYAAHLSLLLGWVALARWFQETAPDSWGRAGKLTADK